MRKQGAGKFPALILYNEMMTVPGKNLFSQMKVYLDALPKSALLFSQ